jgi:hypothetical protein
MNPKPLSESQIWDIINAACERMNVQQRHLWEMIRIDPEKWRQHPYGDMGVGFWAVALIGTSVVWYNEIENGFNRSQYTRHGLIDQYWCNQDNLGETVQTLLDILRTGYDIGPWCRPPTQGEYRNRKTIGPQTIESTFQQ